MAKSPKKAAAAGHNSDLSDDDRKELEDRSANIIRLTKQRADINAKMNADRKAIKALGIDLDAWRSAMRRKEMDPDVRAEFDRSQSICNDVFGIPVQADLFEAGTAAASSINPIPANAVN